MMALDQFLRSLWRDPGKRCCFGCRWLLLGLVVSLGIVACTRPRETELSPDQIRNYAQAALAIERKRQVAYQQVQEVMEGQVPQEVCDQQNTPPKVQTICKAFLAESDEIIQEFDLTIAEFNDITRQRQQDATLNQQVQGEVRRLQTQP